jgi:hypothetical protein
VTTLTFLSKLTGGDLFAAILLVGGAAVIWGGIALFLLALAWDTMTAA